MEKQIEVLPDRTAAIDRAIALIQEKIAEAIAARGQFTIALCGGSTPKPLYEALAAQNLPWDKIHIFWGDERYVAPDHPDSNEGMVRQTWLNNVPIPPTNIHPIPTGAGDPAADAQKHDDQLREFFGAAAGEFPSFDFMLQGMGDDGHTASLFPHTEVLQVRDRLVAVGNKDGQPRITFTVPLINQARCVLFFVIGASKKPALAQVLAPEGDALTYPSRLIQPQGEFWWLLDAAAGSEIH